MVGDCPFLWRLAFGLVKAPDSGVFSGCSPPLVGDCPFLWRLAFGFVKALDCGVFSGCSPPAPWEGPLSLTSLLAFLVCRCCAHGHFQWGQLIPGRSLICICLILASLSFISGAFLFHYWSRSVCLMILQSFSCLIFFSMTCPFKLLVN